MRRFVIALLVVLPLLGGSAFAAFGGDDGEQQTAPAPSASPADIAAFEEAASEVRASLAGSDDEDETEKPKKAKKAKKPDRDRGEGDGPPPWAKAHGRRCKGKSKAKAEGEKHSEFVRCVHERKAKGPKKAKSQK